MQLRPYQTRDLGLVRGNLSDYRSVLLVQPTGAGKGTLAAHIVQTAAARGFKVIFLVNRRTLVNDMSKRLTKLGVQHGVIMGNDPRRKAWLPIHVASIDTLQRREQVPEADLLIIDEAHFCVSAVWKKVVDRYPEARILGMTATPIRLDGRGLGEMFDVMVPGPQVQELIDQGHLVPSTVLEPDVPNLKGIAKIGGDFNQKQLATACNKVKIVGDVVKTWKREASERKTIAFAVDKNHAKHIVETFLAEGVNAAYVDCDTPDEERQPIWDDLEFGNLQVVVNVGVISYGFDCPIVSCVIGARPTASIGLWLQQIGRGSRPHPGKKDLLILDHGGNTERLDCLYADDRMWDLSGAPAKDSSKEAVPRVTRCVACFRCFRYGPVQCPFCGAAMPRNGREIKQVEGDLGERQRERKLLTPEEWQRKLAKDDKRRSKFLEFCEIAHRKGYKKGWPAMQFKLIFHTWPVKAWIEEAEAKGWRPVAENRQEGLGL